MFSKWSAAYGLIGAIFITFGAIVALLGFSYLLFTFGYWLIVLILEGFFGFVLPFSWWYSLGAWLIGLILGSFILPGNLIRIKYE